MRNHFSIIFEQLLKSAVGLAGLIFIMLLDDLSDIIQNGLSAEHAYLLPTAAILLAVIALRVTLAVFAWAKTYITVDDKTLTVEKNTINKKKNTISIQHISNVNLEQSILERLFGTTAVKIDTNTLSTANSNDIRIVLKQDTAAALKERLLSSMAASSRSASDQSDAEPLSPTVFPFPEAAAATPAEVFLHGLFATRIFSLIITLGTLGAGILTLTEPSEGGVLASIIILAVLFFSSLTSMIKGFLKCYDFRAGRQGDRLFLKYGILKKVNYILPLDKINAVNIVQTPIARIFGRYTAEVVNIGMGDEDDTENCTVILYCKKAQLLAKMNELLPEYEYLCASEITRQPRELWLVWSVQTAIALLVCISGFAATWDYHTIPVTHFLTGALLVLLAHLLLTILRYHTRGSAFHEKAMVLVWGCFGTIRTCINYQKIQYLMLRQNPLTRTTRMTAGRIYLLASALNVSRRIPYCAETRAARLPGYLLGHRS